MAPARVLFVGVFSGHSTNTSLADAFERHGCEVQRYDYRLRCVHLGPAKRDGELLQLCKTKRPQLVIFCKGNGIDPEVLRGCGKTAVTCLWYMDPTRDLNAEIAQKTQASTFCCVALSGTYRVLRQMTERVHQVCGGYDELEDFPVPLPYRHSVSFIGMLPRERLEYWRRVGFHVYSQTYGIEHSFAVAESMINLNFALPEWGASDRAHKILAGKGFLLTEPWPGLGEAFAPGRDLDVFFNVAELKEKVAYYLRHGSERDRIRAAGYRQVARFSTTAWAAKILELYRWYR